jgi:hypothetical protein
MFILPVLFRDTVDFDPGAGIYNLKSMGGSDIFVAKLNSAGNLIWARQMGGGSDDAGYSIAIDDSGNVITTGYFQSGGDFDPDSINYYGLSANGGKEIFVSKLNANGKFVWAKSYGGYGEDIGYSVAVNDSGYVFLAGSFSDIISSLDTISYQLTTFGGTDILVMKLNPIGDAIWARQFGGSSDDAGLSIKVDASGNTYITGFFQDIAYFANDNSYYPALHIGSGQKLSTNSATPLNLISAGSTDIFVLKIDSAGNTMWAKRAGGFSADAGCSVALDQSGNVVTSGYFNGIANFDPGTGTYNLSAAGDTTAFISKYDTAGNFIWAKKLAGNLNDAAYSVTTDASGCIYTTGYFQGTVNFDPNAGNFNMTAVDSSDIFISKLNAAGNFVWAKQMGGTRNESGSAIAVDTSGNVYTTGCFSGTVDFDPDGATANYTSLGDTDAFICKYHHPDILQVAVIPIAANCNQSNGSAQAVITGGTLPYHILWSNGDSTNIADTLAAGTYSVYITDGEGLTKSVYFVINNTGGYTLTSSVTQNVNCKGGNDGAVDLTITGGTGPFIINWSNGASTQNITGLMAGTYDVNVTDANGCMGFTSVTILDPTEINYSYNYMIPSCGSNDGELDIISSGGTPPYTYLWGTGETTDTIMGIGAGNYIVTITDANSCNIVAQISLSNMGGPIITVDSLLAATCGGSGAAYITVNCWPWPPMSYNWSNGFNGEDLVGYDPGNYSLMVTDSSGCIGAAQIEIPPVLLPVQPICMVTVDSLNNGNKIIWQKVLTAGVDYYKIYRETSVPDQFLFIDTVRFTSMSKYTDSIANPETRSWSYKISQVDLCGYESPLSELALHKTIHLTMNHIPGGPFKLVWDDYEGYDYTYFYINRHTTSSGWMVIDSVAKTTHTYTDVPPSQYGLKYFVSVKKPDSCTVSVSKDQTETYNTSVSNMEEYQILGIEESQNNLYGLNIYPNPADEKINVEIPVSNKDGIISTYNMQGQLLSQQQMQQTKTTLDISTLAKGVYFVKYNSNEKTRVGKFVKE